MSADHRRSQMRRAVKSVPLQVPSPIRQGLFAGRVNIPAAGAAAGMAIAQAVVSARDGSIPGEIDDVISRG